jgi:hypothetical protein
MLQTSGVEKMIDENIWTRIPTAEGRSRFTEEDIKQSLIRFAKSYEVGERTSRNYREWKQKTVSLDVLNRRYGGFRKACEHFGIKCSGKVNKYDVDDCLEYFEKFWVWRRQSPSIGDFERYKIDKPDIQHIHHSTLTNKFGRYSLFVKDFSDYKLGIITKDELVNKDRFTSKRKPISMSLRYTILKRDNGECTLCGAKASTGASLEVDHIIPVSRGGTNTEENLRILCDVCNRGRSNRDME